MNIRGIHGSEALHGTGAVDTKPAKRHSSLPPAPGVAAAKTHISGPGRLFSGLQQLAEQDPERFKQVAQQISDQLSATADGSTGRASALAQKLAERFGEAAQTGDLSPFRPGAERGGIGHRHHHDHHHHDHGHHLGGSSGAVRSVLENALDLVHQALSARGPASGTADTSGTGAATAGTSSDASATSNASASDASASDASATSEASASPAPNPPLAGET